jgi:hypothetical protein
VIVVKFGKFGGVRIVTPTLSEIVAFVVVVLGAVILWSVLRK